MRSGSAPLAYRCLGTSCEAPLNRLHELERALAAV